MVALPITLSAAPVVYILAVGAKHSHKMCAVWSLPRRLRYHFSFNQDVLPLHHTAIKVKQKVWRRWRKSNPYLP